MSILQNDYDIYLLFVQDMIEGGDTDEFNEAIKGFEIKSYEDLQVYYQLAATCNFVRVK